MRALRALQFTPSRGIGWAFGPTVWVFGPFPIAIKIGCMWSISIYKILIGVVILWSPDDMAQYTIQSDVRQIERPLGMSSLGGGHWPFAASTGHSLRSFNLPHIRLHGILMKSPSPEVLNHPRCWRTSGETSGEGDFIFN